MNTLLLLVFINQLSWQDYTGKPDSALIAKGFVAHTETKWVIWESRDNRGKHLFEVEFSFVPEESWTITNSRETLAHENTHYLISLLWFNKFKAIADNYANCNDKEREQLYNKFNHYWKESKKLQILFDRETHHGIYTEIERIWERSIFKDINKL